MSDFDAQFRNKIRALEDEQTAVRRRLAEMNADIVAEWRQFYPLMWDAYEDIRKHAGWHTVRFRSMDEPFELGPRYHEFSLLKKNMEGDKQSVVWTCISLDHKKKYSQPLERWRFSAPPHSGHMSKVQGRWIVIKDHAARPPDNKEPG